MTRIAIKVTGAQGQGINSVGEMCAKGLKRAGYCVFGYREYMSLIKGGHSSYQLDISNERIESSKTKVDILVCFNHHGLENNVCEVENGGIILHQTPQWSFPKRTEDELKKRKITVMYLPTEDILRKINGKPILGNVLITSVVWALLGRDEKNLTALVKEQFGHKGEKLLKLNYACIDEGFAYEKEHPTTARIALPKADASFSKDLLITGGESMGLGLVHAGCRLFAGYPMTPSSPILAYIAKMQNETGMVVKQAEDEITAAQMMSGAMYMGTRAATATSGGGFDLMTETVSLNGMIENPSVFVLAQRPGPATGLPTWTGQGDLHLAVGSSHGEFPRVVLSASNAQDSFDLMNEAFNFAEEYQTPVIVLTDKQIVEALFTQPHFDQSRAKIQRGKLVSAPAQLSKLKGSDRYDPNVKDGVSKRWLPGSNAATYCAQGDEHDSAGNVDESAANAIEQMEKRMRKMQTIKEHLPEPELFGSKNPDILLVGFGSTKGVVLDALRDPALKNKKIGYLHYTYMWPLRTELFAKLSKKAKTVVNVECNHQGQLGKLLTMESGVVFKKSILQYDGRPFFCDELVSQLKSLK